MCFLRVSPLGGCKSLEPQKRWRFWKGKMTVSCSSEMISSSPATSLQVTLQGKEENIIQATDDLEGRWEASAYNDYRPHPYGCKQRNDFQSVNTIQFQISLNNKTKAEQTTTNDINLVFTTTKSKFFLQNSDVMRGTVWFDERFALITTVLVVTLMLRGSTRWVAMFISYSVRLTPSTPICFINCSAWGK